MKSVPLPVSIHSRSPAPSVPESARIYVGERGYIHGIDGMLSQVAGALVGQAMPHVSADHEMQARVGRAIGQEIAKPLWTIAAVGGAAVLLLLLSGGLAGPRPRSRVER